MRFDLMGEVCTPATLQLDYRVCFKDPSQGGSTRYDRGVAELPVREIGPVKLEDYPGTDSRPLILQGSLLERSPSSVRKHLEGLTVRLMKDGVASGLSQSNP